MIDTHNKSEDDLHIIFSRIMQTAAPTKFDIQRKALHAAWIDTPLGPMLAISDDDGLYLLEFINWHGLEQMVIKLKDRLKASLILDTTSCTKSITDELTAYFSGTLTTFKTPLHLIGTDFQKLAWQALQKIPYGETRSYLEQAYAIGKKKAYRAVANANAVNRMAIIIPCHRIINNNGELGGYGGGIARKKWLLDHEAQHASIAC